MELRDAASDDIDRLREVVESTLTSSFRLSPQQIDNIVEDEFGDQRLTEAFDSDDEVVLVAETSVEDDSELVVGFFWGSRDGDRGDVRWLFVDPEHRGQDVGTNLLETGTDRLESMGASDVRAYALQAGMDGHQFFERFGYEQTDERRVDIGDETLSQFVFTRSETDGKTSDTGDETGENDGSWDPR